MHDLLTAFLESLRARSYSPATLDSRGKALLAFLSFLKAKRITDAHCITRAVIQEYTASLMTCGRYKVGSVLVHLSALRAFFAYLERTGILPINPCDGVAVPKEEDRLPKPVLTPSEVRRILTTPSAFRPVGIRDRALLELLYSTGLRLQELTSLSIHDLDLKGGLVRVNCGKGGRGRVVPMGQSAVAALKKYLPIRQQWSRLATALSDALWLCPQAKHQSIGFMSVSMIVRRNAQRAGLTRSVSPHVWRHTCATHLLRNGANLISVQQLLGHKSIKNTQIYTRVSIQEVKQMQRSHHPRDRRAT
jgi:integrase/recombinase XerD